jgi:hypothetical protein
MKLTVSYKNNADLTISDAYKIKLWLQFMLQYMETDPSALESYRLFMVELD